MYGPGNARGFSPIQAGNVRLEGLYFDYQAELNDRLVSGNNVRVGLTAQGYPFPAPTGVADFTLRPAGPKGIASTVIGYGPFGGLRAEIDVQRPLAPNIGFAAGVGLYREKFYYGGDRRLFTTALAVHWRPNERCELVPFWSFAESRGAQAQPIILSAGPFLPPRLPRRRYLGPTWAENLSRYSNYGALGSARFEHLMVRGGLFRSVSDNPRTFTPLFLQTDLSGVADRLVLLEPRRTFASTSGELRVSRTITDGPRLHEVLAVVRGRAQDRRFGRGERISFGRGPIVEGLTAGKPTVALGEQTTDGVRQITAGVGYRGRIPGVGEVTLGLQRSSYQKRLERPSGPVPLSKSSPWLPNGGVSADVFENLIVYGGYSRGLEESLVAPETATNRDEAPPAILTDQIDGGIRLNLGSNMRLVGGLFRVRKPYFAVDLAHQFRRLGEVQNRGVELSLAGQPMSGVSIVLGTVLLDSRVRGDAVNLNLIGRRPVGLVARVTNASADWEISRIKACLWMLSTKARVAELAMQRTRLLFHRATSLALGRATVLFWRTEQQRSGHNSHRRTTYTGIALSVKGCFTTSRAGSQLIYFPTFDLLFHIFWPIVKNAQYG